MKIKLLKNYFVELWLLFVSAIALTIMVLSFVLYKNFEASTIETINRLNRDSLRETSRINEYVRRMIRTSGMELFSEPSIRHLMYGTDLTNFEVLTGIRRIDSVQSMGRFIHSIFVYNAATNYVYATSDHTSNPLPRFEDRGLEALLFSEDDPRRLIPIARYAETNNRRVPVHTFVFYSTSPFAPDPRGALIMNVTLDWLGEIVRYGESDLYVLDTVGTVIYNSDRDRFLQNLSHEPFARRILTGTDRSGVMVELVNDNRSLVLYEAADELWFVRVFDYAAIMADLRRMQVVTLYTVLGVLALGVLVAFFLSRRLYRPIRRLVRSVGSVGAGPDHEDLTRLSSTIESIVQRSSSLERAARSQLAVLRQDVMKELLAGELFADTGIAELFAEYGIAFRADAPFCLVAARTDAAEGAFPRLGEAERDAELDCGCLRCALTVADTAVVLLQAQEADADAADATRCDAIEQLRRRGARVVAVADHVPNAAALPAAFARAVDIVRFGFLLENGSVVSTTDRRFQSARFEYPTELERRILHAARTGDSTEAKELFAEFLQRVSAYRYDHFRFAIRRLFVSVQAVWREVEAACVPDATEPGCEADAARATGDARAAGTIDTDGAAGAAGATEEGAAPPPVGAAPLTADSAVPGLESLPNEPDSIEQLTAPFAALFDALSRAVERSRSVRHREVAQAVECIIAERYADANLSLQAIADRIGLSPSYLSKIFREVSPLSVADAINAHRIEVAKRLLVDEECSAREIAVRVGFNNENYFYTLFRKKVGVTPAVYRREAGQSA